MPSPHHQTFPYSLDRPQAVPRLDGNARNLRGDGEAESEKRLWLAGLPPLGGDALFRRFCNVPTFHKHRAFGGKAPVLGPLAVELQKELNLLQPEKCPPRPSQTQVLLLDFEPRTSGSGSGQPGRPREPRRPTPCGVADRFPSPPFFCMSVPFLINNSDVPTLLQKLPVAHAPGGVCCVKATPPLPSPVCSRRWC